MTTLTMTHTHADGTLLDGTTKNDASWPALKASPLNWRWSRDLEQWYVRGSRDRRANSYGIETTIKALQAAGFEVELDINDTARPTAQVEADRVAQSAARTEALATKGERLTAQGDAGWERAREMSSVIPPGQPLLTDHYSYGRDRRYRDRIHATEARAIGTLREGKAASERAVAAEANQRHHLDGATTERRILKLEAERRAAARNGRSAARLAEMDEQITYWKGHLAKLVESGEYRVWGPADFTKGDYARIRGTWLPVVRVNKKTLTVPSLLGDWTGTAPYDDVTGHRSAEEMDQAIKAARAAKAAG